MFALVIHFSLCLVSDKDTLFLVDVNFIICVEILPIRLRCNTNIEVIVIHISNARYKRNHSLLMIDTSLILDGYEQNIYKNLRAKNKKIIAFFGLDFHVQIEHARAEL